MAREIVLLAGMHRSGTSALARVVNLLGATLPEPLVPPSLGNELGHWEPAEVVAMNDRALLAAGADVNGLHPLSREWTDSPAADAFIDEIAAYLDRVAPEDARVAIKDPRIAVLAPYWRAGVERLGVRPRFVFAFRDPWEVARSLSSRQLEHFPDEVWPHGRVIALWLKHQLELERATRGAARSFVGYADVLVDWRAQAQRLFDQLDLALTEPDRATCEAVDAFLRPEARRQRRSRTDREPRLAGEVLALLRARRGDPDGGVAGFDAAAAAFEASLDLLDGYLRALEARVGGDEEVRRRAEDADAMVAALREAVERAELVAAERVRAAPGAAPEEDASSHAELARSHSALKAAHRRTAAALRTGRAAWDTERERLLSAAESAREHAEAIERETRQARDADGAHASAATETFAAERDALLAKAAEARQAAELEARTAAEAWTAERDRLGAELGLAREAAEGAALKAAEAEEAHDSAARSAAEAGRRAQEGERRACDAAADLQTERGRGDALDAAVRRLSQELGDHRDAYEALRAEAADARARAARARAEVEEARARVQAERARSDAMVARSEARARGLESRLAALDGDSQAIRAQLQVGAAGLAAAQAEVEALRRSSSWKLTRPFRSVAFRLRRL